MEKSIRTNIHTLLKTEFGRKICSTTYTKDEEKFIKISTQFARGDSRAKWEYPEEYTHFILHKENVDTIQATLLIANAMKMRPANFVYCGTKDKRAKTSQWVCVKKVEPSRIFGSTQRIQNIQIEVKVNIKYPSGKVRDVKYFPGLSSDSTKELMNKYI